MRCAEVSPVEHFPVALIVMIVGLVALALYDVFSEPITRWVHRRLRWSHHSELPAPLAARYLDTVGKRMRGKPRGIRPDQIEEVLLWGLLFLIMYLLLRS